MNIQAIPAYDLVKKEAIAEINGTGYILSHKKTKARVLIIENDDNNKVFDIAFRTPPSDDCGIPHILEHSVLCGSEKYPLKDPFVELAKGSLNTFLNAMTYSDKTVYPIASCNLKDFENLMDVYLDAVFHPNIYNEPKIMAQEGWHYELTDVSEPLIFNGVVFNEMKGAFSSAEQMLYRHIESSLFPDTPYGCESGGDPVAIPKLTYERFLDFHRTYYHPSNSYIYIYGDCDMEKELNYIDSEYLSKYAYKEVDSTICKQAPYAMKDVHFFYPIGENEDTADKTFLAKSLVACDSIDKKTCIAMEILDYVIMAAPGAPLKKALVDAGIGEDVYSSYDSGVKQTSYSIIAQNANVSDKEKFLHVIEKTLTDLAGKGDGDAIDKKSLEAAINIFEFKHKEADFGRYPKGLMLGLNAYDTWLYDDDSALELFKLNEVYDELRAELDTDYFANLISKYLLDNTFGICLTMEPKPGMDKETAAAEAEVLAAYKATLSEDELAKIIKETAELKAYQAEETSPEDMRKLPLLTIDDLDKEARKIKNNVGELAGVPFVSHDIFTNGIGYLDLYFNIGDLEEEYLPYIALLDRVFKYVDTENYTYGALSNEINANTGGIYFTCSIQDVFNKKGYYTSFQAKLKAVYEKLPKALELLEEIIFTSNIADKKRLKEIIAEEKASTKPGLTSSGHTTAATRALAYISDASSFKDKTAGIHYYDFIVDLDANFEDKYDEIVSNLTFVAKNIFAKNALTISYTSDKEIPAEAKASLEALTNRFEVRELGPRPKEKENIKNEGIKTASQVQYVAAAGDYIKAGHKYNGALNVLQVIFSYGYLWENVRVQGGAYGAMCSFTKTGPSYFVSYRDPNLAETYDIFNKAHEFVANFDCDHRDMFKYIIGTIAKLDAPMTPKTEGAFCQASYFAGLTEEMIKKERDEILSATPEIIRSFSSLIKSITDAGIICTIGGEEKVDENADIFKEIRSL